MNETEREDGTGGVKLDLSINLPTILTMVSMLVGAVLYVNNRFSDLSNQNTQVDARLSNVEKRQDSTDAAFTMLRAETLSQNSALRSDMRADMRDLKQSIDTLATQMRK
jgi:hypothetical protein